MSLLLPSAQVELRAEPASRTAERSAILPTECGSNVGVDADDGVLDEVRVPLKQPFVVGVALQVMEHLLTKT